MTAASLSRPLTIPLLVAVLHACSTTYVPQEHVLRGGLIPPLDVVGTVGFVNGQPSTDTVNVYSYMGTSFDTNYHAVTDLMVNQATAELQKNSQQPRPGVAKAITLKVTSLRSHYIAFFWKSTIKYTAALGNGQSVDKEVNHASGNVVQDLNGCIAEGVLELLKDATVRAYIAQ